MKQKQLLLLAFLPLIVIAVTVVRLYAQQGNPGITVSPSNFDLTLNKGDSLNRVIRVSNNTEKTVTIKPEVKNFTAKGEEGGVDITENSTSYALSNWVSVAPNQLTINAQETKEFTFVLKAPLNAEPGGHFGSVVFTTVTNNLGQTGAAVSQEVASLLLVKIPGDVHEQMAVESFGVDKPFYEFGPMQFLTRIQNQGAVHEQPAGQILIKNMLGQETAINFDSRNVLPGAIRRMTTTWDKKLLMGKYTAQLILTYGNKGQQLYASTEFYAFPIRYGLIALAILIVLFMLRKRLGKALKILMTGK